MIEEVTDFGSWLHWGFVRRSEGTKGNNVVKCCWTMENITAMIGSFTKIYEISFEANH